MPNTADITFPTPVEKLIDGVSTMHSFAITTYDMQMVHDQIAHLQHSCVQTGKGTAILLYGPAGCGKSTMAKQFSSRVHLAADSDHKGPLYITLCHTPSAQWLADEILSRKRPLDTTLGLDEKTALCADLVMLHNASCLMIDGSEVLFNNLGQYVRTLDWIHRFSRISGCAVVFIANGNLKQKAKSHLPYTDFLTEYHRIDALKWRNEIYNFQDALRAIDAALPFLKPSCLVQTKIARRLFRKTTGRLGQLMRLVRIAGWYALFNKHTTIGRGHLKKAREKLIAPQLVGTK